MQGLVASATIFKLTAMLGIEPKKYKRDRSLGNKMKKYKELSVRLPPSADNTILSFKGFNFV